MHVRCQWCSTGYWGAPTLIGGTGADWRGTGCFISLFSVDLLCFEIGGGREGHVPCAPIFHDATPLSYVKNNFILRHIIKCKLNTLNSVGKNMLENYPGVLNEPSWSLLHVHVYGEVEIMHFHHIFHILFLLVVQITDKYVIHRSF